MATDNLAKKAILVLVNNCFEYIDRFEQKLATARDKKFALVYANHDPGGIKVIGDFSKTAIHLDVSHR